MTPTNPYHSHQHHANTHALMSQLVIGEFDFVLKILLACVHSVLVGNTSTSEGDLCFVKPFYGDFNLGRASNYAKACGLMRH